MRTRLPSLHARRTGPGNRAASRRASGAARSATLTAALVCGCAAGPDYREPKPIADATYTAAPQPTATVSTEGNAGAEQHFVTAESVGGAWWQAFGSSDLDRLVEQALENSPALEQARKKLAQARSDLRAETGGRNFPQADLALNAARQKTNPAAFGVGSLLGNRTIPPFDLYEAQVNVSYSLDLAGANRRELEGLAAQVDYQHYELEAARLMLAGNVVTTAIRRASLAVQIDVEERLLAAEAQQLAIVERRYRAGGVPQADVLTERTLVDQSRAALAPLRLELAQAEHQLAVYLGRTPAQGTPSVPALDALALPTELPLTLPAALAQQRPDIRASAALLHQASANVGVATANLYPNITLSGSYGADGVELSHLIDVWSIGAGLTQPLFRGGELRARRSSAQAAYEAAAAAYRQTLLQGLEQVADALRALEQDALELSAREAALRDASQASEVAEHRYQAGGISELSLIDARRQVLLTELDRRQVQAQRLADTAALYQALGARPRSNALP